MSILARFTGAPSLTAEKYDETMHRIEASGTFPPDGAVAPPGPADGVHPPPVVG